MVLDSLNFHKQGVPFVLMGKQAHTFAPYITPANPTLKISHPASAAYAKANEWNCGDFFNKVNEILISQEKTPIKW
jgi:uracil DNA glycosylase